MQYGLQFAKPKIAGYKNPCPRIFGYPYLIPLSFVLAYHVGFIIQSKPIGPSLTFKGVGRN